MSFWMGLGARATLIEFPAPVAVYLHQEDIQQIVLLTEEPRNPDA